MAKRPGKLKQGSEIPPEHEERGLHTQHYGSDSPTEITDEDYWVREGEYQDVFAVYDTMHEIAHSIGVSWCHIGNDAVDKVQSHAMTQPHDEAMEEALWIAGKNCASLLFMLAEHGKEVLFREVDGNAVFCLRDSRTGVEELVWDEVEERRSISAG